MSRRQPPPQPSIYEIPFNGSAICTDRGQHPQALIARFADRRPWETHFGIAHDPESRRPGWQETPHGDLLSGQHAPASEDTLRFYCRRCGRDVRLRVPSVLAALDALRQLHPDGRLTLDISLLC